MSQTAEWVYTNVIVVKPYKGRDSWSGEETYGQEYEILATWEASSQQVRDSDGAEFVSRHIVYTQDLRPKKLDLVRPKVSTTWTGWEEVRDRTEWDMSFFGETPDAKLVT